MYTLEQARSFIAVGEELHFGRAAARLNMTQPPLSRQIQKLEKAIGVELMERDNRRVLLTAAGSAFLVEARRLIVAADRAPHTARRIATGKAGMVRIGYTAASGFSVLSPLLSELGQILPEVEVDLQERVTLEQMDALLDGEQDLGLVRPPFDPDIFDSRRLLAETLCLAVPRGHELTKLDCPVTARDLNKFPLIMHSPTTAKYFYDLAVRAMEIDHHNVVHTVGQIVTMVALVAAGRGVAFVPASTRMLGIDGVSYLPIEGLAPDTVQIHAIWVRGTRNPALQRFVEKIPLLSGST